ncbi:hypothetical protein TYRP_018321 [Tyrophagus putrescentiae]|nr:hypothetical protein TYRP_018321 [Tyrophagus putrescentiae]
MAEMKGPSTLPLVAFLTLKPNTAKSAHKVLLLVLLLKASCLNSLNTEISRSQKQQFASFVTLPENR